MELSWLSASRECLLLGGYLSNASDRLAVAGLIQGNDGSNPDAEVTVGRSGSSYLVAASTGLYFLMIWRSRSDPMWAAR
jgi:hypothetical protein